MKIFSISCLNWDETWRHWVHKYHMYSRLADLRKSAMIRLHVSGGSAGILVVAFSDSILGFVWRSLLVAMGE